MNIFKLVKRFRLALTGTPRVAQFALTNRCNGRCKICSIWKQKKKISVSLEDGLAAIDKLAKLDVVQITFTGGEPLCNIHVYDFIERARSYDIAVSICVGDPRLLTEESIKKMNDHGVIMVSLSMDTDESKMNDEWRGIPNTFAHFKRVIKIMEKYEDIMLVAAPTITEYTWDRIPQILAKAKELGFKFINISYPTRSLSKDFNIGGDGTSLIDVTPEHTIQGLQYLLNHIENGNDPFIVNPAASIVNIIKFLQDPKTVDYLCLGGWQVFAIDWFCNVYSCWRSDVKIGNILDPEFTLVKRTHNACTMSWFRDFSVVIQDKVKIVYDYSRTSSFDRMKMIVQGIFK